jgi:Tn3 transposase DDE domain
MNKATCLNLLAHAVLVWNTVHMMRIIQQRRASGETMTEEELAWISPMAFSHVIPNGTYFARRTSLEQEGDHHGQVPPYRHGDRIRRLAAERDLAEALPYIFRRLLLEPQDEPHHPGWTRLRHPSPWEAGPTGQTERLTRGTLSLRQAWALQAGVSPVLHRRGGPLAPLAYGLL